MIKRVFKGIIEIVGRFTWGRVMTRTNEDKKFERVAQRLGAQNKLLRTWKLTGGISAQVTGMKIMQPDGQIVKMIVRQHGEVDLKRNPAIAADEFRLLEILVSEGLPVPRPYYLDPSCEIFSTPYLVMEWIEGETEFNPTNLGDYIYQLAHVLAKIHSIDWSKHDLSFLPKQTESFGNRDDSLNTGIIRDTLKSVLPLPLRNREVLLHGDFWPGNTLWRNQQLVSIIDWEDAATGDPLTDVANGRLEVLFQLGIEAMEDFTNQYKVVMTTIDFSDLTYWDLWAALRLSTFPEWGLDKKTEATMRERHEWFVTQAFQKIKAFE
jgi:aminoglycoside phosphotransferase (APT) family kinase protein